MFCVKWLAKLNIFIILVLVSEFVVVAILSEWWSVLTTVCTCLHIIRHHYVFIESKYHIEINIVIVYQLGTSLLAQSQLIISQAKVDTLKG